VSEISINQAAEGIPLDGLTRVYTATGIDPENQVDEEKVDATKFPPFRFSTQKTQRVNAEHTFPFRSCRW